MPDLLIIAKLDGVRVIEYITFIVTGFSAGYFYAGSVPKIVHFEKTVGLQEVRDDYFKKCELIDTKMRRDNAYEQRWNCAKKQIFLVTKWQQGLMESGR